MLGSGHRIMRVLQAGAMRRRDLVTFVARAAAVWPGIAPAQQSAGKVWGVSIPLREHAPPVQEDGRGLKVMERGEFLRHLKGQGRMR